jgi:hypothetical protein
LQNKYNADEHGRTTLIKSTIAKIGHRVSGLMKGELIAEIAKIEAEISWIK